MSQLWHALKQTTLSEKPSKKSLIYAVNRVRNKEIQNFKARHSDLQKVLHKNPRGELFIRYDSPIENTEITAIFYSNLQFEMQKYHTK